MEKQKNKPKISLEKLETGKLVILILIALGTGKVGFDLFFGPNSINNLTNQVNALENALEGVEGLDDVDTDLVMQYADNLVFLLSQEDLSQSEYEVFAENLAGLNAEFGDEFIRINHLLGNVSPEYRSNINNLATGLELAPGYQVTGRNLVMVEIMTNRISFLNRTYDYMVAGEPYRYMGSNASDGNGYLMSADNYIDQYFIPDSEAEITFSEWLTFNINQLGELEAAVIADLGQLVRVRNLNLLAGAGVGIAGVLNLIMLSITMLNNIRFLRRKYLIRYGISAQSSNSASESTHSNSEDSVNTVNNYPSRAREELEKQLELKRQAELAESRKYVGSKKS